MSCHDQSCKNCGSHSCHSHGGSEGCGCSCHSCTCCSQNQGGGCDHGKKLLEIADLAWMEALKEKIKQHILASDHKIDEIAKIVGEANRDLWRHKMDKVKVKENYECRLLEAMGKGCCNTEKKNDKK